MKTRFLIQIISRFLYTCVLAIIGFIYPLSIAFAAQQPTSSTASTLIPSTTPICKIVRINRANLVYESIPSGNNLQLQWFCPAGYVPIGIQVRDIDTAWTHGTEYYESGKSKPPGFDYIQLRGQGTVIGTGGSWAVATTYFAGYTDQSAVPVQYQVNYAVTNGNALPGKERPNRVGLICARREITFVRTNLNQCFNN